MFGKDALIVESVNVVAAQSIAETVLARLEPEVQAVLSAVKAAVKAEDTAKDAVKNTAARLDPYVYLVGGSVRDVLLGRPSRDLDFVSETSARMLGTALQERLGGTLTAHDPFLTCTLTLPNLTLDFSTARTEVYARPGALPEVALGTLQDDLYRRDFSVNTFAVNLIEPHTLLSVTDAVNDLEHGLLRTLHDRSFFDDPTRIVRGARLAGRLGFRYDEATQTALMNALAAEVHKQVSPSRLKNELLLTLAEPEVAPAITALAKSGALTALYGLKDTSLVGQLDALEIGTNVPLESYLLALMLGLSPDKTQQFITVFALPKRLLGASTRLTGTAPAQTEAEKIVKRVLEASSDLRDYRRVSGSDVLSLGLSAGPEVGRVLAFLAEARQGARVASFADELALAERLVDVILQEQV